MSKKIFSKIDKIPRGRASNKISKLCLVLEGGAFRGLYSEGVLDALMLAGINAECTIGVSAGAMNGMNYVSGQIGRAARINLTYRHDSRYIGLKAIKTNKGVVGFDFVMNQIDEEAFDEETFFDRRKRFVVVATNCLTGKPEYFDRDQVGDKIYDAVSASASMPFISKMVEIEGVPYLDGGCSNKIPYRWALDQGYEKIIVVRTRPSSFRRKVKSNHLVTNRVYKSYPEFAEVLARSDQDYNRQCDELTILNSQKRLYVISPSVFMDVNRLEGDLEKLGELYKLGFDDTVRQIKDIMAYLYL